MESFSFGNHGQMQLHESFKQTEEPKEQPSKRIFNETDTFSSQECSKANPSENVSIYQGENSFRGSKSRSRLSEDEELE